MLGVIISIVVLIAWIWTVITAFRKGGTMWGLLNLLLICVQPIIGIVSAAMKKADWIPVAIMTLGMILSFATTDYTALQKQIEDAIRKAG